MKTFYFIKLFEVTEYPDSEVFDDEEVIFDEEISEATMKKIIKLCKEEV